MIWDIQVWELRKNKILLDSERPHMRIAEYFHI